VVLGGLGINLRDLTMLYVALADGGTMAPLASEEGAAVKETPFLGSLSAYYLRKILEQSPAPDGVMSPYLTQGRAIAFKTGTSYGFRDAWAVGYSGAYTVGVWVGRVEGSPRPGSFGRNTAAPLVFDIFGVLPPENEKTPLKPKDAIETSGNAGLPIALRRLSDVSETRPHLYFPPAAATVDLLHDPDGDAHPVTLRSQGGKEPLRWIVNGEPIKSDGGPELVWRPEGPGFVQVTIIDDSDRSTHSTFRLRATKQD
jgi:penicillin-binding protein 1C